MACRVNTKIGPVLEVTASYLQGKKGVEIRIESVNNDNSHSRVRIFHDFNKLVTDLSNKEDDNNEQETSEMQFEIFALKTNVLAFKSRSKAKAKSRTRISSCSSTRTVPIKKNLGLILNQKLFVYRLPSVKTAEYSSTSWWSTSRRWWSDWVLEIEGLSSERFVHSQHWSDKMWKSTMARDGGNKKNIQYCTDPSRQKKTFSKLFKVIQDVIQLMLNCKTSINSERFLRVHLSHRMCDQFTLHHKFRIDTGRTNVQQKSNGIFYVCGSYGQRIQRSGQNWPGCTSVKRKNIRIRCFGSTYNLLRWKTSSCIKHDRTQSSFRTH